MSDHDNFKFCVESGLLGHSIHVAVQHSGNPGQSTGLMFFGPNNEILLSIEGDDFSEMVINVLKRWKGNRPESFQEIKTLL